MVLSPTGEVADFLDADQMQAGKSQFECGFFAVAVVKAMAEVGKPPTQNVAQVIANAEQWYAQYDGSDAITNTNGMSLQQLYDLLHQVGLHYQETALDIAVVKRWLVVGYPVIVAITETSVHDLALGDASPYPWTPAGTHIIIVTGITKDSVNVLVRDTANCTSLYNANSLRPGPRTYDAAKLQLVSATVCVPPWLPRPASAVPPVPPPAPSFGVDDLSMWNLLSGKLYPTALPTDTGIAQVWLHARLHGQEIGPPLGPEFVSAIDNSISFQRFVGGLAKWSHVSHSCTWYDARGAFAVPA